MEHMELYLKKVFKVTTRFIPLNTLTCKTYRQDLVISLLKVIIQFAFIIYTGSRSRFKLFTVQKCSLFLVTL